MHRLIAIALWIIFILASLGGSFLWLISKLLRIVPKLFVLVS